MGGRAETAIKRSVPAVVEAAAKEHPEMKLVYGRSKHGITFHSLRRTFATWQKANGTSDKERMAAGGWCPRAAMDRYVV